jgi:predicted dehydrogenase
VRVLVVGLGSIGRRHLSNLRRLMPEAHITVWRHARSAGAEQASAEADRIVYGLDEALSPRPDMAILASPASCHVRTAAALASAGVHMLIEKPLSDSLDGVDALLDDCRRQRIVLMVGYHLRFSPSLTCLHHAIADGVVGRVLSVRSEVGQYLPDWRPGTDYRQGVSARRDLGGGVVLELSHELDYVRWLGGEIRSVSAETGQLGGLDIDVEDVAEILLRFTHGAIGSVHVDMLQRSATRTCKVIGAEGTLEWDGLDGRVRLFSAHDGRWTELCGPSDAGVNESDAGVNDMYVAELAHFIRCAVEGGDVPVDGVAGRRVLEIALAAKRSAECGQVIWVGGEEGK